MLIIVKVLITYFSQQHPNYVQISQVIGGKYNRGAAQLLKKNHHEASLYWILWKYILYI